MDRDAISQAEGLIDELLDLETISVRMIICEQKLREILNFLTDGRRELREGKTSEIEKI